MLTSNEFLIFNSNIFYWYEYSVFFHYCPPLGRKKSDLIFFVLLSWYYGKLSTSTKERKNQFSIEVVRRKLLIDRYTKRLISFAYQTTSAFRYRLRFEIFFILSLPIETAKKTNSKLFIFLMKACIREWLYWTKSWVPWGSSVEITETVKS